MSERAGRLTTPVSSGHNMPAPYDGATYTMLPDSGANETHWTLSVVCSGCTSWSGGSVDPTDSGAVFAYGMSSTAPADTADPDSMFGIHQAKGGWQHDMATGANADFDALVEAALTGEDEAVEAPMC